ncbi:MAG: hypothetical protein HON34_04935 [Pelagibacteraceae bacterium]|jgi:hypothetical protein|nr:hypothetical protein [Pelagibacteraceae bacterium]MBT5213965.1 hypothetical protein [Pelagibacteraceae bacterium]MBT6355038.1 hypothetical protein [Pelagibacteraceae bacterium]
MIKRNLIAVKSLKLSENLLIKIKDKQSVKQINKIKNNKKISKWILGRETIYKPKNVKN